jgi:RHS repeat-associated protein
MNVYTRCLLMCALAVSSTMLAEARAMELPYEEASRYGTVDPVTLRGQSSTLLPDGTWLLLGGEANGQPSGVINIYDAATKQTMLVGTLRISRSWHSATLLPGGKVLVFGGTNTGGEDISSPELLDPRNFTSILLPDSGLWPRAHHVANMLTTGEVLLAGGTGSSAAQLWDPVTQTAKTVADMLVPRMDARSTLLATNPVLIYGGTDRSGQPAIGSELYVPEYQWFEPADYATGLLPSMDWLQAPAAIAESIPSDGGHDVPVATRIAIRFNKRLDVRSLNSSTVTVFGPTGVVPATVSPVEKGVLLFVTLTQELLPASHYTAFIRGAADTQGAGVPLLTIAFSTAALSANTVAPNTAWTPGELTIVRTMPVAASAGVWQPPGSGKAWVKGAVSNDAAGKLPQLKADANVTALAGQVLLPDGSPLPGVAVSVAEQKAVTDAAGRFLIAPVSTGHIQLIVDGRTANTSSIQYGQFVIGADIRAHVTNALGYTIWMPVIDMAHAVNLPSPTSKEVDVTSPLLPGVVLKIPAGVVLREPNGRIVTTVSLTPVPLDRSPFPIPPFSMYFVIQPGGAHFESISGDQRLGAQLVYPNASHRPAGTPSQFMYYDPSGSGWTAYGRGHVSRSRDRIDPDDDVHLPGFSGFGDQEAQNPPAAVNPPPSGCPDPQGGGGVGQDGDPVDCFTGLFLYSHVDMVLPDTIPIVIRRTYQSSDTYPRNFGVGFSHDYGMWLDSSAGPLDTDFTTLNLVSSNGSLIPFTRTAQSPASGLHGVQMTTNSTPSNAFFGALITYDDSSGYLVLTTKDGTHYKFNAADGRYLREIVNRNGQALEVVAQVGQTGENYPIATLISPNGRWVKIQYAASDPYNYPQGSSQIAQITDSSGRTLTYAYDTSGRLTQATYPDGGTEEYTYDGASNRILTVKLPNGQTKVTNVYDTNGRVTQQTLADGGVYHFAYTLNGSGTVTTTTVTDPNSNVRIVNFNAAGYVISQTLASGSAIQQATTFQRDPTSNFVVSKTDALNRTTNYVYDSMGNVTSVTALAGTANAVTVGYSYTSTFNQLASVTDPLNHTTTLGYDPHGDLTSITDGLGHTIATLTYNTTTGLPTQITDALSHSTTLTYQGSDLVSLTDALNRTSTRFVDPIGRLLNTIDPLGNRTSYTYDAMNHLKQMTDATGAVTSLTYDLDGNLKSVTDPRGGLTQYTYDGKDRVITRTDPLSHAEAYSYDVNDNLTSRTDRKNQQRILSYDALNRLTQVQYKTASGTTESTVGYTYDAGNRATTINDSTAGAITRAYDGLNRLTSEATASGSIGYQYDAANRRTQMTVSGQSALTYGYDAADRLTGITQGSSTVTLAYDNANRRSTLTLPNGIILTYGYDNANELTGLTYQLGAATVGSLTYAYDNAGRIIARGGTFDVGSMPNALTTTTFDAGNHLTKWGTGTLTYDLNGNLTSDGTQSYTWNTRDQLTAASGTHTASFGYDGQGRRANKTIDGTTRALLYDGVNLAQELSSGTAVVNYLNGLKLDEAYSRTDSTSTLTYLADNLGSTAALTDNTGSVQTSYTYEPYGNTTASGSTSSNSLQYAGRENDGTQLYYYRARYYSPTYGRFASEDPIGLAGGINTNAYVGGNPISRRDPLGLWSIIIEWYEGVGGAVILGQEPGTNNWFYGGRLGFGIGGGFSIDPEGNRPGAKETSGCGGGTTVGTFISAGASAFEYQFPIEQAAGGIDLPSGRTYSEGPTLGGGLTIGTGTGLDIGGSFGIEVIGHN